MQSAVFSALVFCLLPFGSEATAQLTLEIPEEEFEAAEKYKPIPPVSMDVDLTGTLPEAVIEEMLGKTPYDFVDVVWGMEVTGNWTKVVTGTGTLQVTDFTEGRGASTQIDPERYTGQEGFRMYNAGLQSDEGQEFRLFAAFPPDHGGVAFGTELDDAKGFFDDLLCHMFEPDRRGCIDYPDEYYETELPELSKLQIIRKGSSAYKMEFAGRVRETRTHRDRGYSSTDLTGRIGDVRGWVCDLASWEADAETCVGDVADADRQSQEQIQEAVDRMEEEIRRIQAEADNEIARVRAETFQAEVERQMQEDLDRKLAEIDAHLARVQAEIDAEAARVRAETFQAEAQRQAQEQIDRVQSEMEAEIARVNAEIMQAETARKVQEHYDWVQAQIAAEIARAEELYDAAIAEADAAFAEAEASEDAGVAEDETDMP